MATLKLLLELARETWGILWDEFRTGRRTAAWLNRLADDIRASWWGR